MSRRKTTPYVRGLLNRNRRLADHLFVADNCHTSQVLLIESQAKEIRKLKSVIRMLRMPPGQSIQWVKPE